MGLIYILEYQGRNYGADEEKIPGKIAKKRQFQNFTYA